MSDKIQLKKNTFWGLLDIGLYPLLMIACTPLFINKIGIEQYGMWMMTMTINQFMYVLNFGMGETIIKSISSNRATISGKRIMVLQVNKNWTQALCMCLLCVVLGFAISFSGIVNRFFHIPEYIKDIASHILFLAIATTGLKFCEMALLSILKGYERFDIAAQLSIVSKNSVILVGLPLIIAGYSLLAMFICTFFITAICVIIELYIVKKHYTHFNFKPHFKRRDGTGLENKFWYWLQSAIGLVGFLTDKMLVGHFAGLKVLGYYSLASMIGTQIHNALTTLGTFVFPMVSYRQSVQSNTLPLYYKARYYIATAGFAIILLLVFSGSLIFKLWLGPEKYNNSIGYINMYLVYIAVLQLCIIPYQFINASQEPFYNSIFEAILRTSQLICMLIGFYMFDIYGLMWGLIGSTVLSIIIQHYFFHRITYRINSIWQSIVVVFPALCFIPFLFNVPLADRVLAALLLVLCVIFIYYKPAKNNFASNSQ